MGENIREQFDQIVTGQLPPSQWYEFGLDGHFPCLEPNSELGKTAIKMATDWSSLEEEWQALMEKDDETGDVDISEFEELDKTWLPINMRKKIFQGFYENIAESLQFLLDKGETPLLYGALITDARSQQLEVIEEDLDCSEDLRAQLREFANELSMLYWDESGSHFQDLQGGVDHRAQRAS